MKFAFSSNAFLRHNILETIKIVSGLGYEGIEIMADVPHAFPLHLTDEDISAISKALDDNNLSISNVNAFMHNADGDTYHPSWIENEPDLREKRTDYTLRCIELATKLGARNISTEPGGPLDGISREEGLRLYRQGLMAVEGAARANGIKILIEPEPGLLVENSTQFLDLFKDLDPAVFGINFDVGHFYCVNENLSQLIHSMKDYIHHFHLEDISESRVHHHLMLGHGAIDLHKVLDTIQEIG
ncbi:MAG: sugar phosphate isomerase/epimerase family protein, partial [Desulfomonilaceae bacterium]